MRPSPFKFPQGHPAVQAAKPARRALSPRPFIHAGLFLAFSAVGGMLLIWPQYLSADGARAAVAIQQEREEELAGRLESLRAMNDRLRDWGQNGRRVFLTDEIRSYPNLVKAIAGKQGAKVQKVAVTGKPSPRWRGMTVQASLMDGEGATGEIQPREVRLVLSGTFDGVYRTVATLTQQHQLVIPDRWTLVPLPPAPGEGKGERVRAEVAATVFVVNEPENGASEPKRGTHSRVALLDEALSPLALAQEESR